MATVYRYFDARGVLLYVGITRAGPRRGTAHAATAPWWRFVHFAEFDQVDEGSTRLIERFAIWTERPLFNVAGRVSTAERQRMRLLVAECPQDEYIGPRRGARILGLTEDDYGDAIAWGFLQSDFPRAHWVTHEALLAFIGEIDHGPADPHRFIQDTRHRRTSRLQDVAIERLIEKARDPAA